MSTATLVSVEEYLATSYRPDCDFVDGQLIERNVGTKDHSKLQREVLAWFRDRRRELRLTAFPEQRVQVAQRRYRIPDVCVFPLPEPDEQIFTQPLTFVSKFFLRKTPSRNSRTASTIISPWASRTFGFSTRHRVGAGRSCVKGI